MTVEENSNLYFSISLSLHLAIKLGIITSITLFLMVATAISYKCSRVPNTTAASDNWPPFRKVTKERPLCAVVRIH